MYVNICDNSLECMLMQLSLSLSIDISKVSANTINIAKVTHADPRCSASCVAVTTAVGYYRIA